MERNRWLLYGGIAAFALVLFLGLFIPSPIRYGREANVRNNAQYAKYGYTESGDNYGYRNNLNQDDYYRDRAYINKYNDYNIVDYMHKYPDDEHDYEVIFNNEVRTNDLTRYVKYLDDDKITYRISEYSPYTDNAMRTKYPDIPYTYSFRDDDWEMV